MSKIAFLGLGAMGSRMAARLITAGHEVMVWNRSPERAAPLRDLGAEVAATPRAAAEGAAFVIAMLRDDEASRETWLAPDTGALPAMNTDAVAIESSTLTVGWVREWAAACAATGVSCLDAPVAGSRPQAEAGQLIYLLGGDAATVSKAEAVLSVMGSALHHAGAAGAGAGVKLAVNTLFAVQLATVAELIGLLKHTGVDAERSMEVIGATPVCSPAARVAAGAMVSNTFAPLFPIELVEKDLGYTESLGAAVPLAKAARAVYASAIEQGYGGDNITGVAQLYLK